MNALAGFLLGAAILLETAGGTIYAAVALYAAAVTAQAAPVLQANRANTKREMLARIERLEQGVVTQPGDERLAPAADIDGLTMERPQDDIRAPDEREMIREEGAPLEEDDNPPEGDTQLPDETAIRIT